MKQAYSFVEQSPLFHGVICCALVLAFTLPGIGKSELFINGDEARHAVTGVYFRDLLHDQPFSNPVAYTKAYYVHYPALGVIHWPPFFHLVEGLFFTIFGISVLTARMCVIAFALMLTLYFYALVRDRFGAPAALVAAALLSSTTAMVYYSRAVMLEIPSLALCMAALFHWLRYLDTSGRRHLWLAFAGFTLAALTRQHSLLLGPLFVALAMVQHRTALLWSKPVVMAGLMAMSVVVPYYGLTVALHGGSVANDAFSGARGDAFLTSTSNLTYYLEHLPKQAGVVIPVIALVSIGLALFQRDRQSRVFVVWMAVCYLLFTAIAQKDSRYLIYWLPPICAMAGYAVYAIGQNLRARRATVALLLAVPMAAVISGMPALTNERDYVQGCAEAAQRVAYLNDKNPIFYQGQLNGSFIFHIRASDTDQRSLVLRGSKLLYVSNILNAYGKEQLIDSEEELIAAFDRNAMRYAVVEDQNIMSAPGFDLLVKTLESDRFVELEPVAIKTNVARFFGVKMRIFEYKEAKYPDELTLTLPMMTLSDGIEVKVW